MYKVSTVWKLKRNIFGDSSRVHCLFTRVNNSTVFRSNDTTSSRYAHATTAVCNRQSAIVSSLSPSSAYNNRYFIIIYCTLCSVNVNVRVGVDLVGRLARYLQRAETHKLYVLTAYTLWKITRPPLGNNRPRNADFHIQIFVTYLYRVIIVSL